MDYRRNFQPGGTFFFTAVTYRRQPIFNDSSAIALLQQVVREVKAQWPFRMEAWVILPDHVHMIWTLPEGDADFSKRWSKIKSQFTRRFIAAGGTGRAVGPAKVRDGRRGVWQPKFYEHTIRDEDDFVAHVEYVHFNPVKHRLVDYPDEWLQSSFGEYVGRGIYPAACCRGPTSEARRRVESMSDVGLE